MVKISVSLQQAIAEKNRTHVSCLQTNKQTNRSMDQNGGFETLFFDCLGNFRFGFHLPAGADRSVEEPSGLVLNCRLMCDRSSDCGGVVYSTKGLWLGRESAKFKHTAGQYFK